MPNEFDTNKNQLDLFSYSESKQNQQDKRQKIASSGFTATVWTLSGVVLAACSLFEDDEGLGGGSVSVNASPVRDARLYFDIDGDGDVDEEDVRIQNEQYPGGFITGADGRATGIPLELLGRPYIALLDGAVDDATEQELEGQYSSLEDEDGNHLIASPITDLIADAIADTNQPNTVPGVVAEFTPSGVDAADILAELRNRDSYLPDTEDHSPRIVAVSKYLADNQAREVLGREDDLNTQIMEVERILGEVTTPDALIILSDDNGDSNDGYDTTFTVGEHDTYIGLVNAVSGDNTLTFRFVDTNGDEIEVPRYEINERGVISAVPQAGETSPVNTQGTNLRVRISDGTNTEYVDVTITVNPAYELVIVQPDAPAPVVVATVEVEENDAGADMIAVIQADDTAATEADFVIRDAFPEDFDSLADKFEIVDAPGGSGDTFHLKLIDTEHLDHEAIPGGTFDLHVSVTNSAGDHSNVLTITVTVGDVDDITFSGQTSGILYEDRLADIQIRPDETNPSIEVEELVAEGTITITFPPTETPQDVTILDTSHSVMSVTDNNDGTVATVALQNSASVAFGELLYTYADNSWVYRIDRDDATLQSMLRGDLETLTVNLSITDRDGIAHEQSIVINVHGANEDVRFVDGDGNRITRDVAENGIEIGLDATSGVNLGDVVPMIAGQLDGAPDATVALASTTGDYAFFSLASNGDLTFTGTAADIESLGDGVNLRLAMTAPESTTETIYFDLRVNVVNLVDNGPADYEIMGDTSTAGNTLEAVLTDPDGIASISYQWYRGDDPATRIAIGTGQATYEVTTDDVDQTLTVDITYTDASAAGMPITVTAATTPVEFTSANLVEPNENDANWQFQVTATSEDSNSDGSDSAIASYELLEVRDENGAIVPNDGKFLMSNAGLITISTAFDRETDGAFFTLRVRATDTVESAVPGDEADRGTQSITIRVGDVNDNAPAFTQATYTADIDETLGNGAEVARVSARDDDGTTANNTVGYSITAGNTGNVFDIDDNGVITVLDASELDFETTPSYTLTITATDNGSPAMMDTATVTITVNDVNDITPTYMVTAGENSASVRGTEAGGNSADVGTGYRITITDADTTNTFRGNFDVSDRRFDFVETSAGSGVWELTLLANEAVALSEASLTITYQVYDGTNTAAGGRGSVTVAVVDSTVTYTATQNAPLEIAEADNIDTTTLGTGGVLAQVTAESSESQTITYTLTSATDNNGSDVSSLFVVDSDDGEVRFANSTMNLDYEAVSEYSLVITASARQSATTMETDDVPTTVIIRVMNEQEGDGTYIIEGNVAAGGRLNAVVTDPDGTRSVTYEWYSINPANNARTVLGATQSITLPAAADFDDSLTYHVDIVHIDNLGDRHEETLDASAVVFDIQKTDNTAFPSSIAENTDSLPVVVATLDGDTRSPTYTFVGGDTITTSGVFTISQSGSTAGAITVNAPSDINFETAQEFNDGSRGYTLNVRATFAEDTTKNLPEVTGDVVVTIIVTDENDNAPIFTPGQTVTAEIPESRTDADGTILTITASDLDGSDENKDLTYSIVSGNTGNAFFIDPSSGEIRVAAGVDLNYDVTTADPTPTRSYTLMIGVTDGLDDTGATDTTADAMLEVTITITDANDSDPVLGAPVWRSTYETSVPEDTGSGVHLFTVTATDADTATTPPPTLTYRIVTIDDVAYDSATAIFGINGSNGEVGIALDNALDRETKASHKIVIEAFDEGVRTSNQQTVIVTVGDVNEHKPVLGEPEWVSDYGDNGVPEDAYTGAPLQIFTATATDRDATNNGFSYEIVSVDGVTYDSSTSIFAIRAGRVGITSALDYATAPEIMDDTNTVIGRGHEIVIVAIDNSGTGMRSEPGTITVLVANRDDGPAVFEVSPTQANKDILEVEVDTADPDGLDGTYSYQWFTTTDDGVTQVDITGANGRRFDTTGRTDPTGTVIGVRVEYTDNAGTEYSQANGNAPFAVNTTLRFTESYSITLTDGDASPTLPVFADDLELNGDAITTGLEFTFATNGNPGNLFTLSSAGVLTFTGSAVDFDMATDAEKSFNLIIVAEATAGGETTTAIIPVTVEDVNDNDPTLSEPFDTASAASDPRTALSTDDIDEGAGGVGATTSISFEASDADTVFSGAGQTALGFTITATAGTTEAQTIADMFEMVYDSTNDIYTLRLKDGMALNAEAAGLTTNGGVQQIELRIQATDGRTDMPTATPTAGQGLSDARTVTITVNDVNDFDPVFRNGAEHTETISEEMAVGTTVVSTNPAPARDGDATAANRDLEYSIVRVTSGGVVTGAEFFTLDTSTGGITLAQKLDYESTGLISNASTDRGYVIELLVKDQDDRQDTQMLTVVVTDEDDTDPAFGTLDWQEGTGTAGATTRTIDENTTGTLLTIPISDVDTAGGTLAVRIVSGNSVEGGEDLFVFAKNTANTEAELSINPNRVLNYEDGTTHTLVLEVSDGTRTATETVTITVNNLNDETPTFTNDPIVTWEAGFELGIIPEDTDVSGGRVLVGRVAISDDDGATNFLDERVITIAGAGTKFEIERNTDTTTNGGTLGEGLIYLNAALDREGVGADDAEYDAVKITVTDGTLPAVTSDAFSIFIDDVNEGDPVIAVTGSPASFTERTASGNEATGVTFTISDADTGSTYTSSEIALSGDSRFDFVWDEAMQSGTVVLKDTETLDYETAADRTITLTLTVTDPLDASVTETETITINVTDGDDADPAFGALTWQAGTGTQGETTRTIDEDETGIILSILVSDPDTTTLTASIQGTIPTDSAGDPIFSFGIPTGLGSSNEAILSVISSRLDYETATSHTLTLVVSDGTRTDTETVTINVGNVNEESPVFGAELVDFGTGFSNGIIPEDTAAGTVIGVVDVSDADGDVLTVTVLPGLGATQDLADKFEVVYNMAQTRYELKIKMGASFNLEGATPDPSTDFGLRLRATDGTNSVDSPTAGNQQIAMRIGNVNDENPGFGNIVWIPGATTATTTDPTEANTMRTLAEDSTATQLAIFTLTDGDAPSIALSTLMVEIDASGNPTDENGRALFTFVRDGNSGVLALNSAADLDYEHMTSHDLVLVVTDGANTPGVHRVTINVGPVDEGDAVFAPIAIEDGADLTAPAVGETLTFTPTPTTNDPDGNPASFTPTWFRQNSDGTGRVDIDNSGAMDVNQYTITTADVGKVIGVRVDYADGGNHDESVVLPGLSGVVPSGFTADAASLTGTATQYDPLPVDALGQFTYAAEGASSATDAMGATYSIKTDSTHGMATIDPMTGAWTFNVDNTHADVLALTPGGTASLDTKFTVEIELTDGTTIDQDVTITINAVTEVRGTAASDTGTGSSNPLDRSASTTFEVIQGGEFNDKIIVGSGGSVVFGSYGNDDITLSTATGVVDVVVVRYTSAASGGFPLTDGADVIRNFEVGVDKFILVDTDSGDDAQDLADWKDEDGAPAADNGNVKGRVQLTNNPVTTNDEADGFYFLFSLAGDIDGPGPSNTASGTQIEVDWHADTVIEAYDIANLPNFEAAANDVLFAGGWLDPTPTVDPDGTTLLDFEYLPSWFSGKAPNTAGSEDNFIVTTEDDLMITILDFIT